MCLCVYVCVYLYMYVFMYMCICIYVYIYVYYYAESHGVIYVIDSTDEERLSESKEAFEKMISSEALEGVPLLVLANKQDVPNCLSVPDIKTTFSDCAPKIGKRDCLVQPCTALTGDGVNEGIEWMVKCVVRNIHRPPRQKDIT
uniref:ADP-ribosylation factor related protein 1 n=1 Tax=Haplochromis burtoni TaxID=8153 RepID=A0A3Q3CWV9_HAPBU